jgi:pimeloyl-ACP methyl ester carboxylesterase
LDLSIGDVRSHISLLGDRDRPTLILLHDGAYGTDGDLCWGPVQRALADEFFVVVPDLLGWGRSSKLAFFDRSSYESRLNQLAAIGRTLCLFDRKVLLAGVSFGAELAVRATVQLQWGIPVASTVSIAGTGGRLYRIDSAMHALSEYEPSLEDARRLTSMLVSSMEGLDDHVRRRYENSLEPGHWEALSAARLRTASVPKPPSDESWLEALSDCDTPLLFVEGRDDRLLEPGWAEQMALRTKRGSWEVIDGGHEPNLDRPAVVAELIREFLRPADELDL